MKKRLFLAVLFLVSIQAALADYSEEVFNDWVFHEHTFNVEGREFYTTVSSNSPTMSIRQGDSTAILKLSDCKKLNQDFEVCFDQWELWYHDAKDKDYYRAKLIINEYLAKINITRNFDKINPAIGETTFVELAIKNEGSKPATKVAFRDNFPSEFKISDFSGCTLAGNGLKWEGDLNKGSVVKCSYRITPLKPVTYVSEAKASFFNGRNFTNESHLVKIEVPQYALNVSIDVAEKVEIGEKLKIITKAKNENKEKEITVSDLSIILPAGFKVSDKYAELRGEEPVFHWSKRLAPNASAEIEITAVPEKTGHYKISEKATFDLSNILKNVSFESRMINVWSDNVTVVQHMPSLVKSGEKFLMNISVRNPSKKYGFKNVRVSTDSNMPTVKDEEFGIINSFEINEFRNLRYAEFYAPQVEEDTRYYVNTTASFTTKYQEYIVSRNIKEIEVKANFSVKTQDENVTVEVPVEEKKTHKTVPLKITEGESKNIPLLLIIVVIVSFIVVDIAFIVSIFHKIKMHKQLEKPKNEVHKGKK